MPIPELSDRERRVLEAVIRTYVQTAEPAGSRTLSRRFGLGVSPATIRNTMSDLEEKGFLFHPHTSAGRVPTDMAYRVYVDSLMRLPTPPVDEGERVRLHEQIRSGGSAIEAIIARAAQSLGVLTQELGVALGPRLDEALLERIELIRLSTERILMVLTLKAGVVRTVFVEVPGEIADQALAHVALVLNERLGGLSLQEIRASLGTRLRDASGGDGGGAGTRELLNIFVQEGEQLFDTPAPAREPSVVLGQASLLAEQPEFAQAPQMRRLIELTETPERLAEVLRRRHGTQGISVTIGNEHADPRLERFTVVTAEYRAGSLGGVIGVIGPTRMPYEKVVSLVRHTSQLLTDLLD
ncbi:MAG: heat-inducible transcription repressor HrcA [Gemmatimonadaceae bacterium]|nr:heat-inducible transcription repressor HrcA [Gemmatimonadaceae bacterium]NUQ92907.1 heat-inducible transcription repressor HrcA [Gemmatimonadaceae bacterium]NUR19900.1 heat-inducible transcription repressor HrcA [Gemmatimonadaceae bacterium]NUS98281.1 heat-inducible transcription repressor HrcA [Gemmatimonadaceae bacterium]